MESSRLPRFQRAAHAATPIHLTDRDRDIIRHVYWHRFLRSSHILALVPGSNQQCLRRLKLLYHHNYLERPRAQLDYFRQGGSREMVYGLGAKGAALLKINPPELFEQIRYGENNRTVKRVFLEHALLVSDVMVALELACRAAGVRFISEDQLAAETGLDQRRELFHWNVNLPGHIKLAVVPDRVFAVESASNGIKERRYFFFEADRGTMPVIRKTLVQTSFYRKLLAYEATWSQKIHEKRYRFPRFRVLTITTSAARVKSLIQACEGLERGHRLFLFADASILKNPNILFAHWQTGKLGEAGTLLD